jgi:hypothetical protein
VNQGSWELRLLRLLFVLGIMVDVLVVLMDRCCLFVCLFFEHLGYWHFPVFFLVFSLLIPRSGEVREI